MQVVDLLVRLLKLAPEDESLLHVFEATYEVLHAYMIGSSRKNALYFAKYIGFFQTQFDAKVRYTILDY